MKPESLCEVGRGYWKVNELIKSYLIDEATDLGAEPIQKVPADETVVTSTNSNPDMATTKMVETTFAETDANDGNNSVVKPSPEVQPNAKSSAWGDAETPASTGFGGESSGGWGSSSAPAAQSSGFGFGSGASGGWGSGNGGGGGGGDRPKRDGGAPGGKGCFKCGKEGHFSRECPEAGAGGQRRPQSCYNCGKSGHMSRDCPEPRDPTRRFGPNRDANSNSHGNANSSSDRNDGSKKWGASERDDDDRKWSKTEANEGSGRRNDRDDDGKSRERSDYRGSRNALEDVRDTLRNIVANDTEVDRSRHRDDDGHRNRDRDRDDRERDSDRIRDRDRDYDRERNRDRDRDRERDRDRAYDQFREYERERERHERIRAAYVNDLYRGPPPGQLPMYSPEPYFMPRYREPYYPPPSRYDPYLEAAYLDRMRADAYYRDPFYAPPPALPSRDYYLAPRDPFYHGLSSRVDPIAERLRTDAYFDRLSAPPPVSCIGGLFREVLAYAPPSLPNVPLALPPPSVRIEELSTSDSAELSPNIKGMKDNRDSDAYYRSSASRLSGPALGGYEQGQDRNRERDRDDDRRRNMDRDQSDRNRNRDSERDPREVPSKSTWNASGDDINGRSKFSRDENSRFDNAGPRGPRLCHQCKQPGHLSRDCPLQSGKSTSGLTPATSNGWGKPASAATAVSAAEKTGWD